MIGTRSRVKSWAVPSFDDRDASLVLYLPLWYPYSDMTGSTIYSYDRNRYACTITGATKGVLGYSFDGDDFIDCGNAAVLRITNNLTCSVWFRTPASLTTGGAAFATLETCYSKYDSTGAQRGWSIALINSVLNGAVDKLAIVFGDPATGAVAYIGYYNSSLTANTFYRATFTFASGTLVVYLNGSPVAMTTQTGAVPATLFNTTASVLLGAVNAGAVNLWKSLIGEAEMYNRVVSAGREMNNYLATRGRW